MILVDAALKAREAEGRPIRIALIGAGFISHGLANHIVNTTPCMRLVGVYNRGLQRSLDLCHYAGLSNAVTSSVQHEVDFAIRQGKVVATEEATLLARSSEVDALDRFCRSTQRSTA